MSEQLCLLDMACNYHTNGMFRGSCYSFRVQSYGVDDTFECDIESPYWNRGLRLTYATHPQSRNRVLVFGNSRVIIPTIGYSTWVGNWCWDQAVITRRDAVKFIKCLARSGWHLDGGTENVCKFFDKHKKTKGDHA